MNTQYMDVVNAIAKNICKEKDVKAIESNKMDALSFVSLYTRNYTVRELITFIMLKSIANKNTAPIVHIENYQGSVSMFLDIHDNLVIEKDNVELAKLPIKLPSMIYHIMDKIEDIIPIINAQLACIVCEEAGFDPDKVDDVMFDMGYEKIIEVESKCCGGCCTHKEEIYVIDDEEEDVEYDDEQDDDDYEDDYDDEYYDDDDDFEDDDDDYDEDEDVQINTEACNDVQPKQEPAKDDLADIQKRYNDGIDKLFGNN